MFCPNCGRQSLAGKKFCPSCGLKLRSFVEALANEQSAKQEGDKSPDDARPRQKSWLPALGSGLFAVLLGTLIALLGNTLANHLVINIGVMITVLGMGGVMFYAITQRSRRSPLLQNSIPPNAPTVQLPPNPEPSSITEHTTRKLELKLGRDERRTPSKELFQP